MRPLRKSDIKSFLVNSALLSVAATVGLIFLEIVCRLFLVPSLVRGQEAFMVGFTHRLTPDLFVLRPDTTMDLSGGVATTNHMGLREGPWFEPPDSTKDRLLHVGDSVTFGLGVAKDSTFPHLVGQTLSIWDSSRVVETLDASVLGFDTGHELALLEHYDLLDSSLSLVINVFCFNDVPVELTEQLYTADYATAQKIFRYVPAPIYTLITS